jgi:uncharacterized protein YkwD
VAVLVAVMLLMAASCSSPQRDQAAALVNQSRAAVGRRALPRVGELDTKAQKQAQSMANAGRIYHSPNLAVGVSPGWRLIGENVAVAPNVSSAHRALEASPSHRENMLNPAFNQMGIGVEVRGGRAYLVQVFVQR